MGFFTSLFAGRGHGSAELARRLAVSEDELRAVQPQYKLFTIPKRGGGSRQLQAPAPALKLMQRRLLKRVFARLRVHPAVHGFERQRSILTNARPHVRKAVVVRIDLRDFFPSTRADRVEKYFRHIGWNRPAAALLVKLCCHDGGLPQGAPTSPRLANVVNYGMDMALQKLADNQGAVYTRYADDLTFSLALDDRAKVHALVRGAKLICAGAGYAIHHQKKLRIRRGHQRQLVTGLVVNREPNLPRATRRWLRAVRHHQRVGRPATLRGEQLAGWDALLHMLGGQRRRAAPEN